MAHDHDYLEGWRARLIPKLGLPAQLFEDLTGEPIYLTSESHNKQFVGCVPMGEEAFEEALREMGFERNPLASLKSLSSGEQEEGSWRKVGYDDSPKMQLHVVLYDGSRINNADTGCVYVYAHWELRWDVHPILHLRRVNYQAEEGVRRMKDLLDQHGIAYELVRP